MAEQNAVPSGASACEGAGSGSTLRLRFAGMRETVEVPDTPDFMAALQAASPGWTFDRVAAENEPLAIVRWLGEDRYALVHPDEDDIEASAVAAACSVMADLAGAHIDANPDQLCLHGGGVAFGGRLVVFPSRTRAGKSTLVSRLAQTGRTIFGDDVLPLSRNDRDALALGAAPRLRLPLPPTASASFRAYVDARGTAGDGRYLYLGLPGGQLARHGESLPLGAVVLLDRRPGARARLSHAPRHAVLRTLVAQNFSREAPAGELLARLHGLMDTLPCLALTYEDLEEATALLEARFARWPLDLDDLGELETPLTLDLPEEQEDGGAPQPPPAALPFRRNEGVALRSVEGNIFLSNADETAIHHLNPVGAAIWNLLAEPASRDEAVEILTIIFPDTDRGEIDRDVARLFASLRHEGLIEPAA